MSQYLICSARHYEGTSERPPNTRNINAADSVWRGNTADASRLIHISLSGIARGFRLCRQPLAQNEFRSCQTVPGARKMSASVSNKLRTSAPCAESLSNSETKGNDSQCCVSIARQRRSWSERGFTIFITSEAQNIQTKQTPWSESASELYRPSDRRLSAK
jgi:hypothetical protein